VLKALSQAACQFPIVNSSINGSGKKPEVLLRVSHNFGIAVDTPNGLVVPVVRDVQNHSILSLAGEISRLATPAKSGKLALADMADATLVMSNIGSIGGSVVGPVVLSPMTAIVALGQTEAVPAFETGEDGVERIVKKEKAVLSWSADHRLLDGATIARCAQEVATWLERPELFGLGDE
jgi:2-oxoisovalerate dehydrogenase E2 component (dihydrolipoyl transacylase)